LFLTEIVALIPPFAVKRNKAANQVFTVNAIENEKRVFNAQMIASVTNENDNIRIHIFSL